MLYGILGSTANGLNFSAAFSNPQEEEEEEEDGYYGEGDEGYDDDDEGDLSYEEHEVDEEGQCV